MSRYSGIEVLEKMHKTVHESQHRAMNFCGEGSDALDRIYRGIAFDLGIDDDDMEAGFPAETADGLPRR